MKFLQPRNFTSFQFILVHTLVWFCMIILAKPNFDSYGDMIEVFGWSQHWLMGSDKHPQFLPWMAKLWFMVAPQTIISFYALSSLNLAIGLLGIRALGKLCNFSDRRISIAIGLCVLAFPYLTLADKLNMNSICLSVWPWTCWAFMKIPSSTRLHQSAYCAVFGILGAIAILSKYYSIILLITLFFLSLTPKYRVFYRSIVPIFGAICFCLVMGGHIYWLFENDFPLLKYAGEQGAGGTNWNYVFRFALSPAAYWCLPLIIALSVFYNGNFRHRIVAFTKWYSPSDELWVLSFFPIGIVLVCGIFGLVELSTPWIIPLGFAYTLLLVRGADDEKIEQFGPFFLNAFCIIWPIMVLSGIGFALVNAQTSNYWHYIGVQNSVEKIDAAWKEDFPDKKLEWAAPKFQAARFAFFNRLPYKVEALPALPDQIPAYFPPLKNWQEKAGVIICPVNSVQENGSQCVQNAKTWAQNNRFNATVQRFDTQRNGWRHWKSVENAVEVIFVVPKSHEMAEE